MMEEKEVLEKLRGDTFLFYGRPKIGKSTLASKFPNPVFVATEPGLKYVEIEEKRKKYAYSWLEFLEIAQQLAAGGHDYQTWVIDTIDELWGFCTEYVCAKNDKEHLSEVGGMGKGWSMCKEEFRKGIRLMRKAPTLIMIGHGKLTEIGPKNGKYTFVSLNISGSGKDAVMNFVDHLLYISPGKEKGERLINTTSCRYYEAGSRNTNLESKQQLPLDFEALVNAM